ncbi:hypothetical protein TIFTF001_004107 [Ficus carica]|uniref:WD repeat domain-containing protein 83 n=1 Tax=Ficus carica TaxID=3494 RepID=A0AA88CSP7_FICCA|nr:hypothetical protein TIFTF001_004107 [Ficus carica]
MGRVLDSSQIGPIHHLHQFGPKRKSKSPRAVLLLLLPWRPLPIPAAEEESVQIQHHQNLNLAETEREMTVTELPRKEANILKGHEGGVLAARFNNDGNYCLSCGKDRLKAYSALVQFTLLCLVIGSAFLPISVNAVKFNEYASVVVSAGYDQSLRAWDCRSHSSEPIQIIDSFSDSVMSVCLTKTEIIGGSVDGTVRTFDIRIGREISDDLGQPVNCISMSNDGNCILASCLDSTLRLLDRSTGELLQEYKGHTCKSYKLDCCLTNTDAHITGGSEDGFVYFWDLVDASVVSSFRAHSSVVTSVSYHPKDNCMITASVDGTIRVWKT